MPKKPRRIHVNRSDMWIVGTILLLLCGMTFALGLLLGFGAGEHHGVEVATKGHERHLASVEDLHTQKEEAKLEIVQAYKESKQSALNELLTQQARRKEPKSIADARAYFDALGQEISELDDSKVKRAPAEEEQSSKQNNRVPAAVKSLFEPSVADAQKFIPTSDEWTIQVASFPTGDQAYAKMLGLKKNKIHDAYIRKIKTEGGSTWHSLFVGSYKDKAWAGRMAMRLKKRRLIRDYKLKKVP